MTSPAESELPPTERVHDVPRILAALRRAVEEALLSHKRAGNPVAIWRNDRVEWVQPADIPVPSSLNSGEE
jgi:hypothetical protein